MGISFTATPFQTMITNFAKTVSRTPVTKTTDLVTGDETLTDGSATNISGAFYRKTDDYVIDKPGLMQGADGVLLVLPSVTINKDDKITYNSEVFRVDDVELRYLGTVQFYKVARLFLHDS